ncbi:hypothetical protein C7974DRAFT_400958 [Boeremia exigua]|uniref:uncharacterized protein n=1 Tax=Boeremia exigua TaxID=749465 RepID=UPI001E8D481E|nr:uncharacterized protein C7974DRAFT_400958 [Boeremia exigua]KAH6618817.1 hypothetical protein C7974DRAFT_400958 [Boeremia exigua]
MVEVASECLLFVFWSALSDCYIYLRCCKLCSCKDTIENILLVHCLSFVVAGDLELFNSGLVLRQADYSLHHQPNIAVAF